MTRPRIKFCGMTRKEDVEFAVSFGVDAIGLIFYSKSPRFVTIKQAYDLLGNRPPFMDTVGVFVNPNKAYVERVLECVPLTYLQFHGEEPPDFCSQFSLPFIKAVPAVSKKAILSACEQYAEASAILLDTPSNTTRGGSGKPFNWEQIPNEVNKPIILAGGLNPYNIKQAISKQTIYGVDVCSGVEVSPGKKDVQKMKMFVNACYKE